MNWASLILTLICWYFAGATALATVIATYDGLRGVPFQKRIALTIGIGGSAGVAVFTLLMWLWSGQYLGMTDE